MNVSSDTRRSTPPQNLSAGPMSAASPQWVHPLRNGAQVIIRPIGKDDAALERAFIESLSAQSRRFRFLGQIGFPSDALIRRLTDIDYVHDVAFVALANVSGKAQEIGVARYSISDDGRSCECAVAVSDDFHHQGVGTLLLDACLDAARRFWFVRCYAETISEMDQALKLYSRNGFIELPRAIGHSGHAYNDRWLLRELKAPQETL
jgi:acetyltransferase